MKALHNPAVERLTPDALLGAYTMDDARCTLDNKIYQALRFSALPPSELYSKRRDLVCHECNGPAFFRKASRSGQAACFGARPHKDGCTLAASEYEQNNIGPGDDQYILVNPGQRIVIDLNFGTQPTDRHNDPDEPNNVGGRGGRFVGDGERPNAKMHRRLSTILRNLIKSEQFRTSRQVIEIVDVGEFAVADFFVRFSAAAVMQNVKCRGYWGMIADARLDQKGVLWLNSGGRNDMSICVPEQFVPELYQRFRVSKEEDLAEAYALVLGTLSNSQAGKKYVQAEDISFITLRLAS